MRVPSLADLGYKTALAQAGRHVVAALVVGSAQEQPCFGMRLDARRKKEAVVNKAEGTPVATVLTR